MQACIGEGNGNPLQYSCLENPRDRGAWWAAFYRVAQSWTRLKQLSSSSSYWEVGRLGGDTSGTFAEIPVHPWQLTPMLAAGESQPSAGSSVNVSGCLIRGERNAKHNLFCLSPEGSVEVLLRQPCFIGGLSEAQVASLPWSAAVRLAWNIWPHSYPAIRLSSTHSCALWKGLGWTSSNPSPHFFISQKIFHKC